MSIAQDVQSLAPGAKVELFELDFSTRPDLASEPPFRWVDGTNELCEPIVFGGKTYTPMPIKADGYENSAQGPLARPTLTVASFAVGANGERVSLSATILSLGGLEGCIVRRIKTFTKYLDAANFASGVNPLADPEAVYSIDEHRIDRKKEDNPIQISYELVNKFDMESLMLPRQQIIATMCPHNVKYRGEFCGYSDTRYYDANDNPVTDPALDVCGRRNSSCVVRHTVPASYQRTVEADTGGYASEVIAHSVLENPACDVAPNYVAWPAGWLGGSPGIQKVVRAPLARSPAFVLVDCTYRGVMWRVGGSVVSFSNGTPVQYSQIPQGGSFAVWMQLLSGAFPEGSVFSLGIVMHNPLGGSSKLLAGPTIDDRWATGLTLYTMPVDVPATFIPDGGEGEVPTVFVRPVVNVVVPDSAVAYKQTDDRPAQDGTQIDCTLRFAMPYMGPRTDFSAYTLTGVETVATTKVLPLPFGGCVGAELVTSV